MLDIPVPQAAAPPTLIRAISRSDELIKRLAQLHSTVEQLATQIGGPYPAEPGNSGKGGEPVGAMIALNGNIEEAHIWASRIEQSMAAISRSLGS